MFTAAATTTVLHARWATWLIEKWQHGQVKHQVKSKNINFPNKNAFLIESSGGLPLQVHIHGPDLFAVDACIIVTIRELRYQI
jgi:hypothetical protein